MKPRPLALALIALFGAGILLTRLFAAEPAKPEPGSFEYATIRWGGLDQTHVVLPNGQVSFVREKLRRVERPNGAHDRSVYMNVIMNDLVKEGWQFTDMTGDEIVMQRTRR